ncbi:sigma-70 family RNA polymerase sigma factor [Spongiivirga citrea]|uniref:Sigma-70 family RNA polymerase sigma factor n=1 Tax=Spongiivirga citrea TaxID=1481457 RepID=A0A6M0CQJ8_9FLAO|nr:sigma-70 family RNA polymerase sigma factor [Spongiivirga citrea]
MTIEKLISECKKNNPKAQESLFVKYKQALFNLCLKYAKNQAEAEDILQDTFLTIFKKIKTYKGQGSFEGWMKRIAINKSIDRYKKDLFVFTDIKEEITDDTAIDQNEVLGMSLDTILGFVQALPSKYRLTFNMYELDDYSHKEIAKILSISEGTSKSNLHRAKVMLKEMIMNNKESKTVR